MRKILLVFILAYSFAGASAFAGIDCKPGMGGGCPATPPTVPNLPGERTVVSGAPSNTWGSDDDDRHARAWDVVAGSTHTAGYPCPPNECNIYNGCTDGCSSEQLTCSTDSESQCASQDISTPCRWEYGNHSGSGYCYPSTSEGPTRCRCG